MTVDDAYKRMLETQEAMRRAADPLADAARQMELLSATRHAAGLNDLTAQITHNADECLTVLGFMADTRIAGIDITGLTKIADQVETHRRLLAGPFEDYRNAGLLDAASRSRAGLDMALTAYGKYEHLFRLPEMMEASRLAHDAMASISTATKLYGLDRSGLALETAMRGMHAPWLHRDHVLQSAQSFAEIQAIGHAVNLHTPYDPALTTVLRDVLGDWRALTTLPLPIFENPVARSDFYIGLGFDSLLTEFTARAFDESTALAGLGPRASESAEVDEEEVGLQRNSAAYNQLLRFERKVRNFIDRLMIEAFGPNWIKHHTPAGMMDEWKEKRATAVAKGELEQPLISYSDFSDYIKIIERNDNWTHVFKGIFGRPEDVRESFVRLFPVRICTMHARVVTLDDELLLRVETRRILRAFSRT
jgi:hypothetical protein